MPDLGLIKQAKQAGCGRSAGRSRALRRATRLQTNASFRCGFAAEHTLRLPRKCRPLSTVVPESRAPVHPVRQRLSRRRADDRLLCLRFAIVIAPGKLRPCRGKIMCRWLGWRFRTGRQSVSRSGRIVGSRLLRFARNDENRAVIARSVARSDRGHISGQTV